MVLLGRDNGSLNNEDYVPHLSTRIGVILNLLVFFFMAQSKSRVDLLPVSNMKYQSLSDNKLFERKLSYKLTDYMLLSRESLYNKCLKARIIISCVIYTHYLSKSIRAFRSWRVFPFHSHVLQSRYRMIRRGS